MSTAVQPVNEFNDFEVTYFNEDIIRREAVRYLFFPGDVIDIRRKQEREDLRHGGEEIGSACLVRTRQFLRRCRITPLERWGEPMPLELIPEGVTPIGITRATEQGSEQGYTSVKVNLHGFPKFPGEEIGWILQAADNSGVRKGIVELTNLRAIEWNDFQKMGIQYLFFPDYPKLPATLREVVEIIGRVDSRDSLIHTVQQQMLVACEQFRLWAVARMEAENMLIRMGTTKEGWTYRYSGLAETLLPQLEMGRADSYLSEQTRFQGDLVQAQAKLTEAVTTALQQAPPSAGVNVTELVTTIQSQLAEQTRAMMEQNQVFLAETLSRLFGTTTEETDKPAGKDKKKP